MGIENGSRVELGSVGLDWVLKNRLYAFRLYTSLYLNRIRTELLFVKNEFPASERSCGEFLLQLQMGYDKMQLVNWENHGRMNHGRRDFQHSKILHRRWAGHSHHHFFEGMSAQLPVVP